MKALCPQCGRETEVSDTRAGSLFKCLCKFSFRLPKASSEASSEENSFSSPSKASSDPLEAYESINESSQITDGDVDQYISSLNQIKSDLKKEEEEQKVEKFKEISMPDMHEGPIELKVEKKIEAKVSIEDETIPAKNEVVDEPTVEDSEVSDSRPNFRPAYERSSPGSQVSEFEQLKERALDFVRTPVGVAACAGLALVLFSVLIFSLISGSDEVVTAEIDDPFLKELLVNDEGSEVASNQTKNLKTPAISRSSKSPSTLKVATSQKSLKKPAKTKRKKEVSTYTRSLLAMYEADFEQVRSFGNSRNAKLGVKALALEAVFLDAKQSAAQKTKAKEELAKLRDRYPNSSLLVRTEATSHLTQLAGAHDPAQAIQKLKSLSLTRSTDPLVFAYIGFAYDHAGSARRAVLNLNQALTLRRNFSWAKKEKDRLTRRLRAESSR